MTDDRFDDWTIPVSDEDIVDFRIGTAAQQAAAAARIERDEAEEERRWRALPWYERLRRTLYFHWWNDREWFMGWLHNRLFPDHDS